MNTKLIIGLFIFIFASLVGSCVTHILFPSEKKVIKKNINPPVYHGIDVSRHQGEIDWKKVAKDKNIQFVYIKATEGATFVDKSYKRNIEGAKKYGLKVGSYHYLRNTSSIKKQFKNFTSTVDKDLQDLIPMVDVEERVDKDSIRLFCNLIKELYGKDPMIYGTNSSYNKYCAPEFNNYYKLIGRYGEIPPVIKGKGHYNIWQYSENGKIPGIPKPVDLDRFHPDFKLPMILLNEPETGNKQIKDKNLSKNKNR